MTGLLTAGSAVLAVEYTAFGVIDPSPKWGVFWCTWAIVFWTAFAIGAAILSERGRWKRKP